MSVNKVILIGRIGNDPEVITLQSGSKVASFSLATFETYKNKEGEKITTTEWHKIVVWGKLSDVVEMWCKKGDTVYIEGRLKTESYEKDNVKHYVTKIKCDVLRMLGGKQDNSTKNNESDNVHSTSLQESYDSKYNVPEDRLPF